MLIKCQDLAYSESSAKMSQNQARSLLNFIDDDSSSIRRESPTIKQAENKYICSDSSDDFEAANTEHMQFSSM